MADVEAALLDFYADLAYTVTVTPGDLATRLAAGGKVLRIRRIGGGGDRDNDYPTVSFQSFAAESYEQARAAHDLDQAVWDRLVDIATGLNPGWVDGVIIEDPSKTSGPVELPYPDPATTVVESIYSMRIRH